MWLAKIKAKAMPQKHLPHLTDLGVPHQLLHSPRDAPGKHGIRNQSANVSCKEPGGKYFWLSGYMLSVAPT